MSNNQKQPKKQSKPIINHKKNKVNIKSTKKPRPSLKKGKKLLKTNSKAKSLITLTEKAMGNIKSNVFNPIVDKTAMKDLIEYNSGKKKVGRPSAHDKNMYPKILALAAAGYRPDAIALKLGCWPDMFKRWAKDIPEFGACIKRAKKLYEEWWVEQGMLNANNKSFNAVLWMMNMSNRFRWQTSNGSVNKNIKKEVKFTEEQILRTVQEVEIINGNTSEVARILAEAGALESTTTETIDTTADEVHASHSSS